jgi:hypothetical protein
MSFKITLYLKLCSITVEAQIMTSFLRQRDIRIVYALCGLQFHSIRPWTKVGAANMPVLFGFQQCLAIFKIFNVLNFYRSWSSVDAYYNKITWKFRLRLINLSPYMTNYEKVLLPSRPLGPAWAVSIFKHTCCKNTLIYDVKFTGKTRFVYKNYLYFEMCLLAKFHLF